MHPYTRHLARKIRFSDLIFYCQWESNTPRIIEIKETTGHRQFVGGLRFYNSYEGVCPSAYPCLPVQPRFFLARTPRANHVHSVSGLVFTNQYSASRSIRSFSLFPFGEIRYVLFSTICPFSCSFYLPWFFAFASLPRFSPTDRFTNENVQPRSVIPRS